MATTESLLSSLTARWSGSASIKGMNANLQYVITEPRLEDGAQGVKVTFGDAPVAELGAHEEPDLVVTLSGESFAKLANDELWLNKASDWYQLDIQSKSKRGLVLGRALFQSYLKRP